MCFQPNRQGVSFLVEEIIPKHTRKELAESPRGSMQLSDGRRCLSLLPGEPKGNLGEQTSVLRITELEMRGWEGSGSSGCGITNGEVQGKRRKADPLTPLPPAGCLGQPSPACYHCSPSDRFLPSLQSCQFCPFREILIFQC